MIFSNETGREHETVGNVRMNLFKIFIVFFLLAALCIEGYYILVLRDTIEKQKDDLKNISIQLQSLKSERINLHEELSSIKKATGDNGDDHGNTARR